MLNNTFQKLLALLFLVACTFTFRKIDLSTGLESSSKSSRHLQQTNDGFDDSLCSNYASTQTFSNSQIASAEGYISLLKKIRGGNPLIDLINAQNLTNSQTTLNGTSDNEKGDGSLPKTPAYLRNQDAVSEGYVKTMSPIMIFIGIFLAFAVFCLLGFLCTLCRLGRKFCCCFNVEEVQTGKMLYTLLSGVLMISLLILGIVGFIAAGQIQDNSQGTVCKTNFFLQNMTSGSLENNWLGLVTASIAMANTSNYIKSVYDGGITLEHVAFANLWDGVQNSIFSFFTNYQSSVLLRASMTQPNYTPDFIQNFGGSPAEKNSSLYNIFHEEETTKLSFRDPVSKISLSAQKIPSGDEKKNLQLHIIQAQDVTDNAYIAVQSLINLNTDSSSQVNDIVQHSGTFLKIVFIILCLISIFCLVWWVLSHKQKVQVSMGINVGKWFLILISIIGWIISLILIPTDIRLIESCGAMNKTLSDPSFFNQTLKLLANNSESLNQYFYTCIYGNTDLSTTLKLALPNKNFIDNYNTALGNATILYSLIQNPPNSTMIPTFLSQLEEYKNGVISDSQLITDDLNTLNKNSYPSSSTCEPMQDTWRLNSINCTSSQKGFTSDDADSFNVGNPTCIGFDQWMAGANKDIDGRYTALKSEHSGCQDKPDDENADTAKALVKGFINNRNNLTSLVTNMQNDLNQIAANFTAASLAGKTVTPSLESVLNDFTLINSSLNDPNFGLLTNMNCGIISNNMKALNDSLCVGMVLSAFHISLIAIFFSVLASLASCSLFCLNRRVGSSKSKKSERSSSLETTPLKENLLEIEDNF